MRVPFWPRKNARLERRLTTVIEKSEEVRKSIKAPPSRVVIDTSYVEQQMPPDVDALEHSEAGEGAAYEDLLRDEANRLLDQDSDFQTAARRAKDDGAVNANASRAPRITTRALTPEEELAEREAEANAAEWAALQEAEDYRDYIMRLEEETVREEELRKAAEAKLAEAARLEAEAQQALEALRQLAIERQQAEENERHARERALAAQREAAVQRKRAEELEAELEHQMAGREAVAAEAEAAEKRIALLQAEITAAEIDPREVEKMKRRQAEVNERKAAAEVELEAQAQRLSSLESEIKQQREQRLRMELQRDAVLTRIREAERRLTQLRQSTEETQEALKRQAEVRAQIEARKAEAERKKALAELLAVQVQQEQSKLPAVVAEIADMEVQAAAADSEIAALESREQELIAELELAQAEGLAEDFDAEAAADAEFAFEPVAAGAEDANHHGVSADQLDDGFAPELEADGTEAAVAEGSGHTDVQPVLETITSTVKPELAPSAANPLQERIQQAIVKQQAQPVTSRHGVVQTQPQVQKTARDIDLAAASSVNSPVPLRVKNLKLPETPQPAAVVPAKSSPAPEPASEGTKADRRHRRVAEQKPATLWQERMSEPVNCVIRDKSASGAMLEIMPGKFGGKSHAVAVGDKYTLTIQVARERSHVTCEVIRVEGRRCGIRFCGPFRTEILQKARAKPVKARSSLLG